MNSTKLFTTCSPLARAVVVAALAGLSAAQNHPPVTPTITEPAAPNAVLNPNDVHMETGLFSDPDVGDQHAATDWEIWTVNPLQRVWFIAGITGVERAHTHLGDGVFENSHAGWNRLFADTQFKLRVRHKDDSGDPASEWSGWAERPFSTGAAGVKEPLVLDDVDDQPGPLWLAQNGQPIELPSGAPQPMLRIESAAHWQLLRIDGDPAPGNKVTNPVALPAHAPVRVVIKAGNTGANLVLPASDVFAFEHDCEPFAIHLPAINLPPNGRADFWVSEAGATYFGSATGSVPDFTSLARGVPVPWQVTDATFTVEVVAEGMRMPCNIAFVPNAGGNPGDPKFYVTELYGTIKVVRNDGTVGTYASNLLNYTPSGVFPGSGEQGLTGITVDPVSGDVFVGHLWQTAGNNAPRVTRLTSLDGGLTSSSRSVLLDMVGETQGQSHQISCLEIVNGQLFVHMGDGFTYTTAQNLNSYRGKILRMNLDGSPVTSNPYYNGGTINSRDYVYCLGVRNPFGGAWRAADGLRYCVENGPSIDRMSRLVPGRNYLWDNTNASMANYAIYNWSPSSGPVNIAFVQPQTFGGSGFPAALQDKAFVTESGATYAEGQQAIGKVITQWQFDLQGNLVTGPVPFVQYVGDGYATAVGLAAGPDGLYFTELYRDESTTGPTTIGGRVLRVRYGNADDCDQNGLPDSCEIANGAADCDGDQQLDVCQLAGGTVTDFDQNGVIDVCDPLQADTATVSVTTGALVHFSLRAGAANAGQTYQLLGSMSGTNRGTVFGSVTLPLNSAGDPWFDLTSQVFNTFILQNTIGLLDGNGEAQCNLFVPNLGSLLGLQLHHAFLVTDTGSMAALFASNAVPLVMVP